MRDWLNANGRAAKVTRMPNRIGAENNECIAIACLTMLVLIGLLSKNKHAFFPAMPTQLQIRCSDFVDRYKHHGLWFQKEALMV